MEENKHDDQDRIWFIRIQQDDHDALRFLFDLYYILLCRYVFTLIEDEASSEDIVQDIFVYIWEHRKEIVITASVRGYLFAACRHKAMNHLRDTRKFTRFIPEQHEQNMVYEEMSVETDDLHRLIEEAIMNLPEKCAKVYRLSREEDLSHKEIAEREGIAVKTVEAHIHTALKRMKGFLTKYSNK